MITVNAISLDQCEKILSTEEGHFSDLKAIDIKPAKLTRTVSAFANASGGEIILGIDEEINGSVKARKWRGFADIEAANGHIQAIEELRPLGGLCSIEFLKNDKYDGYVLRLDIHKSQYIIKSSDDDVYIRKGAQNLKVTSPDGLKRLEMDKGIVSFEDEFVNIDSHSIVSSDALLEFMQEVVPAQTSKNWLRKQRLIIDGKTTVASVLLFHDEPQAVLPKRSAIKIYRYKTKSEEGTRETLAFDPITIEGNAYSLIFSAVQKTKNLIEEIQKLTDKGLEPVFYPNETLHEIITNAVIHRDYSIPSDIHIRIYDNRVEVHSPGRLPGHITVDNILDEQAARNPKIVRLINKFPNPPNKDIGEGLNTAFRAMSALRLKVPEIKETESSVIVFIRHQLLASPQEAVIAYLKQNSEITNSIAREITGISSENSMKEVFYSLQKSNMIERVPGKKGRISAWKLTVH